MIHSFLHYRPGTNLETKKTSKKQKKRGAGPPPEVGEAAVGTG